MVSAVKCSSVLLRLLLASTLAILELPRARWVVPRGRVGVGVPCRGVCRSPVAVSRARCACAGSCAACAVRRQSCRVNRARTAMCEQYAGSSFGKRGSRVSAYPLAGEGTQKLSPGSRAVSAGFASLPPTLGMPQGLSTSRCRRPRTRARPPKVIARPSRRVGADACLISCVLSRWRLGIYPVRSQRGMAFSRRFRPTLTPGMTRNRSSQISRRRAASMSPKDGDFL